MSCEVQSWVGRTFGKKRERRHGTNARQLLCLIEVFLGSVDRRPVNVGSSCLLTATNSAYVLLGATRIEKTLPAITFYMYVTTCLPTT
jgi:hypothetical protein